MPGQRTVRTARLRTAIEFLTSIPLGTAPPLEKQDLSALSLGSIDGPSSIGFTQAASDAHPVTVPAGTGLGSTAAHGDALAAAQSGEQLDPTTITVRIRGKRDIRHITSRGKREAPLFRQALVQDGVLDGRIIFARNKEYPSGIFSIIRYDVKVESELIKQRQLAATNMLLGNVVEYTNQPAWKNWQGRSYAHLLHAEYAPCSEERDDITAVATPEAALNAIAEGVAVENTGNVNGSGHPAKDTYHPLALDDPSIDLEKQRRTYIRDGYMFSLLAFRNERSQKDDINEKFSRVHPWLDFGDGQGLTLSKIRSLKKRALQTWWTKKWEVSTVAIAIVYFEKLAFKRVVNKANRKLAMCCCLLLAYKMNEAREIDNVTVRDVVDELEEVFSTPRKQMIRAEFSVFKHLAFGMHIPCHYTSPHLTRLLNTKGTTLQEYAGPELASQFTAAVAEELAAESDTSSHSSSMLRHRSSSDLTPRSRGRTKSVSSHRSRGGRSQGSTRSSKRSVSPRNRGKRRRTSSTHTHSHTHTHSTSVEGPIRKKEG